MKAKGFFRKYFISLCVLVFSLAVPGAYGESGTSVWSVTRGSQKLFIGGTLHLLKQSDYPLPDAFDRAYREAQTLVFETDMAAINSPEIQARLTPMLVLPAGKTLSDMISAQTYAQLDSYLSSNGLALAQFQTMKPAMIALFITVLEMQKLGIGEAGVDSFYHTKGVGDGKKMDWVESIDTHLAYISSMGEGDEDAFLKYSILDIQNLEQMMDEMTRVWREGDLEGLDRDLLQPMRAQFPRLYHSLIVERNQSWLPRIEAMAKTPEIEFILVGAGHLAGDDGILQQLISRGFAVTALAP